MPDGITRARAPDSPEGAGGAVVEVTGPGEVEPRRAGVDQVEAVGKPDEGPVDGSDLELVVGELDDEGHDQVGAGVIGCRPCR